MNPSKIQARKMVLVSVFLLALLSTYRDKKNATPAGTFRTMWGVGVVGIMLSLLADFLPQIAGPFAGLIVLGSLTNGGEQVLAKALGLIGPPPTSGSSSPPSSAGQPVVGSPSTTQRTNPTGGTTTQTGP